MPCVLCLQCLQHVGVAVQGCWTLQYQEHWMEGGMLNQQGGGSGWLAREGDLAWVMEVMKWEFEGKGKGARKFWVEVGDAE